MMKRKTQIGASFGCFKSMFVKVQTKKPLLDPITKKLWHSHPEEAQFLVGRNVGILLVNKHIYPLDLVPLTRLSFALKKLSPQLSKTLVFFHFH